MKARNSKSKKQERNGPDIRTETILLMGNKPKRTPAAKKRGQGTKATKIKTIKIMTRTIESVTTRTVSKATQSGWELAFTHEAGGANESVSCHGNNGSGGMLNASINGTAMQGSNIIFHGADYNNTVAAAVFTEMQAIIGGQE